MPRGDGLPQRCFLVVVLAVAFGIGHEPGQMNTASNDTTPPAVNAHDAACTLAAGAKPTTAPAPAAPITPAPNARLRQMATANKRIAYLGRRKLKSGSGIQRRGRFVVKFTPATSRAMSSGARVTVTPLASLKRTTLMVPENSGEPE